MEPVTSKRNIVVIGSSAGGIKALEKLLSGLPSDSSASFFVVQHLAADFSSQLDRVLQRVTSMHVAFARDGELIMPDSVYVAAPDRHLMVDGNRIRVTRGPKESRVRPAVDVLFRSAALVFGPRVIGVILSGALDDGTVGLWQIKDRGGLAFVQDPAEALHSSMPSSAIEHVSIDCIGPVAMLASRITQSITAVLPFAPVPEPEPALRIENLIAAEGNGLQAGVMHLGPVSRYTCPECHGVLVQIGDGSLVRFRCHTGHAYSIKSLLIEVNSAVDKGLWDTVRAVEERILLLQQRANLAAAAGDQAAALRLNHKAKAAETKCQQLRALVLDADFFELD